MKISRIGWVGKNAKVLQRFSDLVPYYLGVYPLRGRRIDWGTEHYPPRKVRITIEDSK